MFKKIIFVVLSAVVFFAAALSYKLGVFKTVDVQDPEPQTFYLLFKEHIGPYHKIVTVIQQVEEVALGLNLPCSHTFGQYLDDPREVEEDRLKSRGGCLLTQPLQGVQLPQALHFEILKGEFVSALFNGSPAISPYKVYPKLFHWLEINRREMGGPILEVYGRQGTSGETETQYYFPLR
jgi:AraC family transcriptional regulator